MCESLLKTPRPGIYHFRASMAARFAEQLMPLRAIPAAESALKVAAGTSITARPTHRSPIVFMNATYQ